jgi:hypothetical protein
MTVRMFSGGFTINDGRHEDLIEAMKPCFDIQHGILNIFPAVFAITTTVCFHKLQALLLHGFVFICEEIGCRVRPRDKEVAHKGKCNCDDPFDDVQPMPL